MIGGTRAGDPPRQTDCGPADSRQERVFTAATFLGRYGREWLNVIATATNAWAA